MSSTTAPGEIRSANSQLRAQNRGRCISESVSSLSAAIRTVPWEIWLGLSIGFGGTSKSSRTNSAVSGSGAGVCRIGRARPRLRIPDGGGLRSMRSCVAEGSHHGRRRSTAAAAVGIRVSGFLSIIAAISVAKLFRQIRIEMERVERHLVEMPLHLFGRVAAGERHLARHGVIQRAAQRVDVADRADLLRDR